MAPLPPLKGQFGCFQPGFLFSLLHVRFEITRNAEGSNISRLLPQWLTGLIAVSSFLLLTFIGFVVKRMWCENRSLFSDDLNGSVFRRIPSVESVRENQYVERNPYDTKLDVLR
uniref:Uncharacterized protein n=1 Tax=Kryptolebias marmoratus TaxID=37003 RepID=A0A3Q3GZB3_KRYMA